MSKSFMFHFPQEKDKLAFNFPVYPVFYTIGNDPTLLTRSSGGTDIVANEPTESESFDGTVEGDLNFITPQGQPRREYEQSPEFFRQVKSLYADGGATQEYEDITFAGDLFIERQYSKAGEAFFPGSGIFEILYEHLILVLGNTFIKDTFDYDNLIMKRELGDFDLKVHSEINGKYQYKAYDNISPVNGDFWFQNNQFNFYEGGELKVLPSGVSDNLPNEITTTFYIEGLVGPSRVIGISGEADDLTNGVTPLQLPNNGYEVIGFSITVKDYVLGGSTLCRFQMIEMPNNNTENPPLTVSYICTENQIGHRVLCDDMVGSPISTNKISSRNVGNYAFPTNGNPWIETTRRGRAYYLQMSNNQYALSSGLYITLVWGLKGL